MLLGRLVHLFVSHDEQLGGACDWPRIKVSLLIWLDGWQLQNAAFQNVCNLYCYIVMAFM